MFERIYHRENFQTLMTSHSRKNDDKWWC